MPNGPSEPEEAKIIHIVYSITIKNGKSVFITDDSDEDGSEDDEEHPGFPIVMDCDTKLNEQTFPN